MKYCADLALTEGVVERVVDHLRLDAEARRLVAVDLIESCGAFACWSVETSASWGSVFSFASSVAPRSSIRRGSGPAACTGIGRARAGRRREVLRGLQEQADALDFRDLRPQPVDHLRGGHVRSSPV